MAENKDKTSYMSQVAKFYLAPELRSIATVLYLGVFGYITLYYIDSLFLAIRFLFYIILGHTALTGVGYLFAGMAFVLALVAPFFIAFYSILLLHKIWHRSDWAKLAKWTVTLVVALGGITFIIISDEAARVAARQPSMQSFIEDANLTGRI